MLQIHLIIHIVKKYHVSRRSKKNAFQFLFIFFDVIIFRSKSQTPATTYEHSSADQGLGVRLELPKRHK